MSYFRGIKKYFDQDKETIFIFLNADFVMSDNTMRNIAQSINDGYFGIMAPSLRCNTGDIEHKLKKELESGEEFHEIYNSRKLVRNAFKYLHPTVYSNYIDNDNVNISIANQFYFKVDNEQLLARNLLLFMLAIKPTRIPEEPSCFCDYSFLSDLCPGTKIKYFDDSDICFLMELQEKEKEIEHIKFEKKDLINIGQQIKFWATEQHYNNFNVIIKFHNDNIDINKLNKNIDSFNKKLSTVILRLKESKPVSYINHPYWLETLAALSPNSANENKSLYRKLFRQIKNISKKDIFSVSLIHYDYGEYRFIKKILSIITGDKKKAIVLTNIRTLPSSIVRKNIDYEIIEISTENLFWENEKLYEHEQLIMYLDEVRESNVRDILNRINEIKKRYDKKIILILKGSILDIFKNPLTNKLIKSMDVIDKLSNDIVSVNSYGYLHRNLLKFILLYEVDSFYKEKKYLTLFNVLLIQSIIVLNNILDIFGGINNSNNPNNII